MIRDHRAVVALIAMLNDPDPKVLEAVTTSLGWIGEAAVTPLIAVLNSSDLEVRRQAAKVLGWIGDLVLLDY